jgi:hypothetical protein
MHQPGLYYPYVHIRDDDWLKGAALYWPSVRRLVPHGYAKHDSATAESFAQARILKDEDPGELLKDVGGNLLETLQESADRLTRDYTIGAAFDFHDDESRWTGGTAPGDSDRDLAWVHVTKFPPEAATLLESRGLARRGQPIDEVAADPGEPGEWIGLHPALADAYMTVLAGRLGQSAGFQPLTDQTDLRVATPTIDVQAAVQLLLGRSQDAGVLDDARVGVDTYVMLALQLALPKNLAQVSAEKIVEVRKNLGEELRNFRDYVSTQQAELTEMAALALPRRRLEAFTEHVAQTVEDPLRRLENGLKLHKLEPTRSIVLASSFAPPLALGAAAITPAAATTIGALAALGTAWWQIGSIRDSTRASSPVGYLLDVRDALTPKTLAARARMVLRGTYGHRD